MHTGRPTWAEVNLSAIRRNMLSIKSLLRPGARFCAVVKANGYGHGAVEVARQAVLAGADYLAVAILDEAVALRKAGFSLPILILGYTPPEQYAEVVALGLTQTIFNMRQAEALSLAALAQSTKAKAHIKVDTGMGRLGVMPEQAAAFALGVSGLRGVNLEGVFTHFAKADSHDKSYTRKQFASFMKVLAEIQSSGLNISIKHCANSAATLDLPETHLDMVRVGIALYGLEPSAETGRPFALEPAMRFKTRIALLKTVPKGACVSYGCTFVAERTSQIATLPVGYADGWPRCLGNKGVVAINGRRVPLAGRVCMDQCMADVTGLSDMTGVAEGAEVLLFGGRELPVEEIAALAGTINYEMVCMVSARVPRVYIEE